MTALNEEYDRIYGFDVGADDYVVKPFSANELMKRVHAVLKRAKPTKSDSLLTQKGLKVDLAAHRVYVDDREVSLSLKEYDLLLYLMQNKGVALTRESILEKVWGYDYFKDEKKWPIKTAKMSTLPGVYRLEYDKPPLTLRPADRQFRPDGYPLGIEDFKAIMGFPDKFEIYLHKNGDTFEGDFKDYHYWLNKARYTIAKGAVGEIGIWFKKCLKKANTKKP